MKRRWRIIPIYIQNISGKKSQIYVLMLLYRRQYWFLQGEFSIKRIIEQGALEKIKNWEESTSNNHLEKSNHIFLNEALFLWVRGQEGKCNRCIIHEDWRHAKGTWENQKKRKITSKSRKIFRLRLEKELQFLSKKKDQWRQKISWEARICGERKHLEKKISVENTQPEVQ